MREPDEQALQRAIATISQTDPLIKLLQQVQLGRMKPTDTGLRAVTESWLGTYRKALATEGLTKEALRRIDPIPRIAMLIDAHVVASDLPAVTALTTCYEEAIARARD